MYAVIQIGNHQYKVEKNKEINIEKINAEVGSEIRFENIVAISDGTSLKLGAQVKGSVVGVIKDQAKEKKILVFKRKVRKSYKRTIGHRQPVTKVLVTQIEG